MKEGWEIKKLGDICETSSGGTPSKSHPEYYEGGNIPWLRSGEISQGHIYDTELYITEEGLKKSSAKIFPIDTVVIAMYGATVGQVGILKKEMSTNQAVCGIFPTSMLSPLFLVYYLKAKKPYFLSLAAGGAQPNISQNIIKSTPIPVPSIAEQEKIVAELDCLSGIIEKKKQQLKEYDALAQSIFYEMFIPANGTLIKLSQACSIVSGLVNPNEAPYCNYPHIGGANIESNTGEFINVKLAKDENLISGKYFFDNTMILYSKIRPNLNKVALPSFCGICSADMYPIIPTKGFNKIFLKFILTQKDFLEYAVSHSGRANIPKINRGDLLEYEFLSYPLSAQQEFASKIEAIEKQKALIKKSIEEVETLFNSRMDQYFN